MKIHDITRPLSPAISVWPGDRPFTAEWSAQMGDASVVNVGAIAMSTHTGTHVDAPYHFLRSGLPVGGVPLERFIGAAQVVAVDDDTWIRPEHVAHVDFEAVHRVLFKTRSSAAPHEVWEPAFPAFQVGTIRLLGQAGVVLVGTDAPSVDPADSKTLDAHHALAEAGITNLENVFLRDVPAGRYQLIALPMRLDAMDAAPVRAILIAEEGDSV